jgi:hypothetical protein
MQGQMGISDQIISLTLLWHMRQVLRFARPSRCLPRDCSNILNNLLSHRPSKGFLWVPGICSGFHYSA